MAQALRESRADDPSTHGPVAVPRLAERLGAFQSLGGNCEFGFVQRYGGVEPSGLLRFSYTPIDDLIHALSTDFSEYGVPNDLVIEPTDSDYYYCRSRRYNIWSNTAQTTGSIDAEALLRREYGRVAHLKRKMLAELADGSKILVRKAGQGETDADFARLSAAIRRHGPSTVLRVTEAGAAWTPQPVRRAAQGILEGSVRRFAPTEEAWDLDLEPWLQLCDKAYAAARGVPEAGLGADTSDDAPPVRARLRRHAGRRRAHGLSAFTQVFDPAAFDPKAVYVFSAWIWIPEAFSASRIFAVMGRERLGYHDADLTIRDRWQRVWAAGRIGPEQVKPPVGIYMIGTKNDRFWSCGQQLQRGPVPSPVDPPSVTVAPSSFRRFMGWRA